MKNKFFITWLLAVIIGLTSGARADSGMAASTLKSLCEGDTGKLICIGYISGVTDALVLMSDLKKSNSGVPIICTPISGVSNDEAMRIVLDYIKMNPLLLQQSARVVIVTALLKAFPC
jgi:Rap1a immunity proteins